MSAVYPTYGCTAAWSPSRYVIARSSHEQHMGFLIATLVLAALAVCCYPYLLLLASTETSQR